MEGDFLFLLVVFAIAILQGIAQKKKQQARKGPRPPAGGPQPGQPGRPSRTGPAPDRDKVEGPAGPQRDGVEAPAGPTAADRASVAVPRRRESTSEGMIPSDVWDEILGLARGQPPKPRPAEDPPPEPIPSVEEEAAVARRRDREVAAGMRPDGPGSLPEEWAPLPAVPEAVYESRLAAPAQPLTEDLAPKGKKVREELFGDGSPEELRKAIILKEVLGQPLALRE